MTVKIHGKEYKTVNERVQEFWKNSATLDEDYAITTEIILFEEQHCVIRATILSNGRVVATGHAMEVKGDGKINKTSHLENCETSAIGRALATLGFGGEEFASADEVSNALRQQEEMSDKEVAEMKEGVLDALARGDWGFLCRLDRADGEVWKATWKRLGSKVRAEIKKLQEKRAEYLTALEDLVDDEHGFAEVAGELRQDDARFLYKHTTPEAQEMLTKFMKEKYGE